MNHPEIKKVFVNGQEVTNQWKQVGGSIHLMPMKKKKERAEYFTFTATLSVKAKDKAEAEKKARKICRGRYVGIITMR